MDFFLADGQVSIDRCLVSRTRKVRDGKLELVNTVPLGAQTVDATGLKIVPGFIGILLPTLTENPAREMGLWDQKGSIADGKDADLVLLDENANSIHVFARGRQVK